MKRKNRDTPGIAQAIIAEYKPQSVAEMQAALKKVFGQFSPRKRDDQSP